MVGTKLWLLSVSLLVVTAGIPLTNVQADVTIPSNPLVDDVVDGIYMVDITSPAESSLHLIGTTETIRWTHEPGNYQFGFVYTWEVQVVRVSDETAVGSPVTGSCGFPPFFPPTIKTTNCQATITVPSEPGLYDILVKTKTSNFAGNDELCDDTRGFFQPCDKVRIRVKEFDLDINVYEVCTRDTLDLHCRSHVAYDPDDRTVEVPADEEAVVSIHAAGLTKPDAEAEGYVNVTGKLRCVDGQPCVDLGGGISRATHRIWSDGHGDNDGNDNDVGTEFTFQARDFFVEGPALGSCHTLDVHVFAETDTHARTDDGTLTLCGVV